jgi:hypothetical protein
MIRIIEIPFSREMAIAAIEGRKVATTRSERKGEIGDRFEITIAAEYPAHGHFALIDIHECDLSVVKDLYFRLEGFDSPEAFEKTWRALHQGHFITGKLYYIQLFGRVA